jgi:hypothetical protein
LVETVPASGAVLELVVAVGQLAHAHRSRFLID